MSFYESLSRYYDDIFPLENEILTFLKQKLGNAKTILDVACGTGTYALPLAEEGLDVTAVDSDPSMIQRGRKKSCPENIEFIVGDMKQIRTIPGKPFDALYCIGNSLVHLGSFEEIQGFMNGAAAVLKKNGICIIQIVNFDKVLDKGMTDLPSLQGPGLMFLRKYGRGPGEREIRFSVELHIDRAEEHATLREEVMLLALRKNELEDMAKKAGFRDCEFYGSYGGAPYAQDSSFLTILTARKA